MPSERTRTALSDIIRNIDLAESFCHGLTPNQFMADVKVFYATTRALEIISEASRRLPGALKDRHADVPWRAIADAGNIYRHGYTFWSATFFGKRSKPGLRRSVRPRSPN